MPKSKYPRMARPKTRAQFLAREQQVWEEMTGTWKELPDAAFLRKGACGSPWSIKDVMNHVAAWQEAALRVLPELIKGNKAGAGYGVERFNRIHYEQDKNLSLEQSKVRFNKTRHDLLQMIETIPDELLLDINTRVGWWIKYTTYDHYSGHIHDLCNFREKWMVK